MSPPLFMLARQAAQARAARRQAAQARAARKKASKIKKIWRWWSGKNGGVFMGESGLSFEVRIPRTR